MLEDTIHPSVQVLGRLIALGVPAAKYNLCNLYGDYLGDWTQYHLQALLEWFDVDDRTAGTFTGLRRRRLPQLTRQVVEPEEESTVSLSDEL